MVKVGIIGATGYAGQELVRLLQNHPQAEVINLSSRSYAGQAFASVYGNHRNIQTALCQEEDLEALSQEADVVFLALPHGLASSKVTEEVLSRCKIIDLGADFRLQDADIYEEWYKVPHAGKTLLPEAVYGLCEWNREKVRSARLVANPGCYTTCSIMTLAPLVKEHLIDPKSIIIDAKSGVSGAGRGVSLGNLYAEVNESVKAYKIAGHRHTPEIEEQLSYMNGEPLTLTFTPHLIPMQRGILAVCYAGLMPGVEREDLEKAYQKYYADEAFVRLYPKGEFPETRWVKGSNYMDIGFEVDRRTGRVIAVGAIDNMVKGAAGQAIQNMNLLFGLPETMGLTMVPMFP